MLFTVGTFMNDRFIFMPSLGFAVLLSMLLAYYIKKWIPNRKWGISLSALLIVATLTAYAIKTFDRLPDWSSHLALNKSAVDEYPNSARSTLFYATALYKKAVNESNRDEKLRMLREANKWLSRSLEIFPEYGNRNTKNYKYFNAYKMKAGVAAEIYKLTGDLDFLLNQFLIVASGRPDINYVSEFLSYINKDVGQREKMINFYHELGFKRLFRQQKNLNYGMAFIDLGLEYAPNSALLNYDKGRIFLAAGRQSQAQKYLQKAKSLDPAIMDN
jgi:tetratricopeptide (TPR) repeat protein